MAAHSHSFWDQQGAHRVRLMQAGCFVLVLCRPWLGQPCSAVPVPYNGPENGLVAGGKGGRGWSTCAPHASAALASSPCCLIPTASNHRKSNQKQPWGSSSVLSSSKNSPQICWISTKIGTEQFLFYRASSSAPCSCGPLPGHGQSRKVPGAGCSPGARARAQPPLA